MFRTSCGSVSLSLVVLLEDLHWAEPTYLDLLEYVLDLVVDLPLLLLANGRPELLDQRPGWSSGRANADLVLLEHLRSELAGDLVAVQPGGSALPRSLAARIAARAEGNPLFVEQMVGKLREDGDVVEAEAGWAFVGNSDLIEVPASIQALLGARLDALADEDGQLRNERQSSAARSRARPWRAWSLQPAA